MALDGAQEIGRLASLLGDEVAQVELGEEPFPKPIPHPKNAMSVSPP